MCLRLSRTRRRQRASRPSGSGRARSARLTSRRGWPKTGRVRRRSPRRRRRRLRRGSRRWAQSCATSRRSRRRRLDGWCRRRRRRGRPRRRRGPPSSRRRRRARGGRSCRRSSRRSGRRGRRQRRPWRASGRARPRWRSGCGRQRRRGRRGLQPRRPPRESGRGPRSWRGDSRSCGGPSMRQRLSRRSWASCSARRGRRVCQREATSQGNADSSSSRQHGATPARAVRICRAESRVEPTLGLRS
mmetsp:Transcript_11723/g.35401  ORF Transcript_11723/g.35401 Transcript_11723/m.35401 type:complete len:244 (+) Transcript_11723:435-1166(+)